MNYYFEYYIIYIKCNKKEQKNICNLLVIKLKNVNNKENIIENCQYNKNNNKQK